LNGENSLEKEEENYKHHGIDPYHNIVILKQYGSG
jgi:hypothetical protein